MFWFLGMGPQIWQLNQGIYCSAEAKLPTVGLCCTSVGRLASNLQFYLDNIFNDLKHNRIV